MGGRFENKSVLVTGGGSGIGRATALASEDASFMVGHTLLVDGGLTAQ